MDYEKKYKEALERAKKAYKKCATYGEMNVLESLFPELKEGEDERIRKDLIYWFKTHIWEERMPIGLNFSNEKVIAWLEKQGEKTNPYSGVSFDYNDHTWGMCARDNGVDISLDEQFFTHLDGQENNNSISPEEISKSIGKNLTLSLINYLDNNRYDGAMNMSSVECEDLENSILDSDWGKIYRYVKKKLERQCGHNPTNKVESKFKIGDWVVYNDANVYQVKEIDYTNIIPRYELENIDGDKLSIPFTSDYNLRNWTIEDAKDGDVLADDESIIIFRKIGNDIWNDVIDFYVCYNFRLDKIIVQKDSLHCGTIKSKTIKPATKEHRGFLFSKMKEAGYEWDVENKVLRKQGEQKSVWSEEDDMMIEKIIDDVTPLGECPDYPTEKQRKFYEECNEEIEWLKSLKQKSHWKPSKEQMNALNMAYKDSLTSNENLTIQTETLKSLLNDLKKL